jgi:hypothetical protein
MPRDQHIPRTRIEGEQAVPISVGQDRHINNPIDILHELGTVRIREEQVVPVGCQGCSEASCGHVARTKIGHGSNPRTFRDNTGLTNLQG